MTAPNNNNNSTLVVTQFTPGFGLTRGNQLVTTGHAVIGGGGGGSTSQQQQELLFITSPSTLSPLSIHCVPPSHLDIYKQLMKTGNISSLLAKCKDGLPPLLPEDEQRKREQEEYNNNKRQKTMNSNSYYGSSSPSSSYQRQTYLSTYDTSLTEAMARKLQSSSKMAQIEELFDNDFVRRILSIYYYRTLKPNGNGASMMKSIVDDIGVSIFCRDEASGMPRGTMFQSSDIYADNWGNSIKVPIYHECNMYGMSLQMMVIIILAFFFDEEAASTYVTKQHTALKKNSMTFTVDFCVSHRAEILKECFVEDRRSPMLYVNVGTEEERETERTMAVLADLPPRVLLFFLRYAMASSPTHLLRASHARAKSMGEWCFEIFGDTQNRKELEQMLDRRLDNSCTKLKQLGVQYYLADGDANESQTHRIQMPPPSTLKQPLDTSIMIGLTPSQTNPWVMQWPRIGKQICFKRLVQEVFGCVPGIPIRNATLPTPAEWLETPLLALALPDAIDVFAHTFELQLPVTSPDNVLRALDRSLYRWYRAVEKHRAAEKLLEAPPVAVTAAGASTTTTATATTPAPVPPQPPAPTPAPDHLHLLAADATEEDEEEEKKKKKETVDQSKISNYLCAAINIGKQLAPLYNRKGVLVGESGSGMDPGTVAQVYTNEHHLRAVNIERNKKTSATRHRNVLAKGAAHTTSVTNFFKSAPPPK